MNQVVAINSGSSISKSSVKNALSAELLVKPNPKKLSIYTFNFTPLIDERVIKQTRPKRGYSIVEEPVLQILSKKPTRKPMMRKPLKDTSETTVGSSSVAGSVQVRAGAGSQCTAQCMPQTEQLPEQVKIDAVLKGKEQFPPSKHKFFFEPLQLLRKDKDMVKMQEDVSVKDKDTRPPISTPGRRELATLHTVCAPNIGAIKLTGLAYELDYPVVYDDRKKGPAPQKLFGFTKFKLVPQACPTDKEVLENSEKDAGSSRNVDWSNPRRTILDRSQRTVNPTSGREAEYSRQRIFG